MRDDSGHESQEGEPSSGAGHGDHSDKALGHKSGPDFEKPMAEPKGTSEAPQVETEDLSVYYLQEAELPLLHGHPRIEDAFAVLEKEGKRPDLSVEA